MTNDLPQISEREREILRLVAMGATNQQIAHQLHISINTVKVHLRNIFDKIGVASRTEATVYAIRQGLVQIEGQPAAAATSSANPSAPAAEPASVPAPIAVADDDPPEPVAPPVTAVPIVIQPEPSVTPVTPVSAPRRSLLLPAFVALSVLLATAVIYLLLRQPAPQTTTLQPSNGLSQISRWKSYARWPQPRANAAIATHDGKFYAIGGGDATGPTAANDRFDPMQNQWVPLNEKPTPVADVQAVTIGGRILIPGGAGASGQPIATFEAYDPRSKTWQTLPPLPVPRSRYALADFEGKLYLFGGWDGSQFRSEVFEYDPAAQTWTERAPMPTARAGAGAAVVEGRISVVGGENERGPLTTNERFDPTSSNGGAWATGVPLATPIATPAVVGVSASVMVFDPEAHTATQYDIASDAWSDSVAIPSSVGISPRAIATTTKIFLFGGTSGEAAGTISEYQTIFNTFLPGINSGQPQQ
jgi:DNA-binding CsgD family transcriptional regulator